MMKKKSRHSIWLKIITMVVVCLLLVNDIVLANSEALQGAKSATLARWLVTRALMEKGVEDPGKVELEAGLGIASIARGVEIRVVNAELLEAAFRRGTKPEIEFLSCKSLKDGCVTSQFCLVKNRTIVFDVSRSKDGIIEIKRAVPKNSASTHLFKPQGLALNPSEVSGSGSLRTSGEARSPGREGPTIQATNKVDRLVLEASAAIGREYVTAYEREDAYVEAAELITRAIGFMRGHSESDELTVSSREDAIKVIEKLGQHGLQTPIMDALLVALKRDGMSGKTLNNRLAFLGAQMPVKPILDREDPIVKQIIKAMEVNKNVCGFRGITFEEFMRISLMGYYAGGKADISTRLHKMITEKASHFSTFPEMQSPDFGRVLAAQIHEMWVALGSPEQFTITEMGVGNGTLAWDIIKEIEEHYKDLFSALKYVMIDFQFDLVERNNPQLLEDYGARGKNIITRISGSAMELENLLEQPVHNGVFISNELPDAFPVHRVKYVNGELCEVYVEYRFGQFVETARPISLSVNKKEIEMYLLSMFPGKDPDYIKKAMETSGRDLPINLDMLKWQRGLVSRLARGYVITIDYTFVGGSAEMFLADTTHDAESPIRQYGEAGDSIYVTPGKCDITSDIPFVVLEQYGLSMGLAPLLYDSQENFLVAIMNRTPHLQNAAMKDRYLHDQILQESSATFKVLVQRKNAPPIIASTAPLPTVAPAVVAPPAVNFERVERLLSAENTTEKKLLTKSAKYLGAIPVNEHIDISAIPKDDDQLRQNLKTLARLIACNNTYGLNIRYVLDNDSSGQATAILASELGDLANILDINREELLSRIGSPHIGDNVINIHLATVENIKKMGELADREYAIALKDNPELPGVSIPNYTAASAIGLSLAALRTAKERSEKSDYEGIRRKVFDGISSIYKRFEIIKDDKEFTIDDLEFMVSGCSTNKLKYAILYALPPIVKDLAERIQKYREALHLLQQAA